MIGAVTVIDGPLPPLSNTPNSVPELPGKGKSGKSASDHANLKIANTVAENHLNVPAIVGGSIAAVAVVAVVAFFVIRRNRAPAEKAPLFERYSS